MADNDKDLDARIKAMQEKIDGQAKEMAKLHEQNLALLATPPSYGHTSAPAVQVPAEPEMNYDGLPDILVDQKGHYAELARRQKAYAREMEEYKRQSAQAQKQAAAQQTPRVNAEDLWALYTEDHPAYAESEAKVRAAAGIAIERMAKRGVDAMALMQRSPEDFFRKVNEVYDKEFGAPEAAVDGDDGSDGAGKGDDADDGGRTAGLFGGQTSGNKPDKGKGDTPPSNTFAKELGDLQDSIWGKGAKGA